MVQAGGTATLVAPALLVLCCTVDAGIHLAVLGSARNTRPPLPPPCQQGTCGWSALSKVRLHSSPQEIHVKEGGNVTTHRQPSRVLAALARPSNVTSPRPFALAAVSDERHWTTPHPAWVGLHRTLAGLEVDEVQGASSAARSGLRRHFPIVEEQREEEALEDDEHANLLQRAVRRWRRGVRRESSTSFQRPFPGQMPDVEEMDIILGLPKIVWVVAVDVIAVFIFFMGTKMIAGKAMQKMQLPGNPEKDEKPEKEKA